MAALEARKDDLRRMMRIWDDPPSPRERYWDRRVAGLEADAEIGSDDPNSPFWAAAQAAAARKAASALSESNHPVRATNGRVGRVISKITGKDS